MEIDNPQILEKLGFLKGFVVLESTIELDVVAVYTGTQGPNWPMNVFHTERVPARCVPVCEDFELKLHTGLADWKLIAPIAGPTYVLNPIHPAWTTPPPAGSLWIGALPTDGTAAPQGGPARTYELEFDLCYGFAASDFVVQMLVDDSATVSLNGTALTPAPSSLSAVTNITVPANLLRAGDNRLRVVLKNTGAGGNGFALAGVLQAFRGRCPCEPVRIAQPRAGSGESLGH